MDNATQHESASAIEAHLKQLLAARQSPKTFCPSEVARALSHSELQESGYSCWREAMPETRSVLSAMRGRNEVEILQKGVVLEGDLGTGLENVVGPIRVRRRLA